jgi:hypothetical protein
MLTDIKKLRYHQQKAQSKGRVDKLGNPIKWKLTFGEWLNIWTNSGFLHLRGRKKGQYNMSRINDIGDYEIGNIIIQPNADNRKDAQLGIKQNPETIAKRTAKNTGKKRSAEQCKKLSDSMKGRIAWNKGKKIKQDMEILL